MPTMNDWMTPRGGGAIRQDKDLSTQLLTQWRADDTARKAAQRLIDWYLRDRAKIAEYIRVQASLTFGNRTAEWQIPLINGVQRTVKRLAMTYSSPPERVYMLGDKELGEDDPQVKNIERMYRGMRMDKRMRQGERWQVLLNTVHIEPVYRMRGGGRIEWMIHRRPDVVVLTDPEDFLHYDAFAQRVTLPEDASVPKGSRRGHGFMVWTDAEHVFIRDDGWVYGIDDADGTNPYAAVEREALERPIPVVTLRKSEGDDYWGRFGADIVDGFEQACIQLGNIWEDAFMQAGIVLARNTGLGKKSQGQTVTIGLKDPVIVEGAIKDELEPMVSFLRPDTPIEKLQDLVDWYIKLSNGSYGMPPSSWAQDEKVMSGFAKMIDSIELLEDRDEGIDEWVDTEVALFEASRMVWNRYHAEKSEHINPEITLAVTFNEVEFPEAPADEAITVGAQIQNGLASAVDWLMKKHKLASREEALELALQITKENAIIQKKRMETLGTVMGGPRREDDDPNEDGKNADAKKKQPPVNGDAART